MKNLKYYLQRTIILLLVFPLITASFYTFSGKAVKEYKALIDNGFESGEFEGWTSFGNRSEIAITSEKSYSGFSSVCTLNRQETWSGPALNITDTVFPGEEYLFRAYVISKSAKAIDVMMTLKTVDEAGNESYVNMVSLTVGNDKWMLFESTAQIPENAEDVSFYFETVSGLEDFCIDNVAVYGYGEKIEVVYEENESRLDFDFEDGFEGWIPRGVVEMSVTDDFSYSGDHSLYVSGKTENWNAPMVRIGNVEPYTNYTYSAYVMFMDKNKESNRLFSIMLQYNLDGEEIYAPLKTKEIQNGTWSKISGNYILPESATDVYFYVRSDENEDSMDFVPYCVDNVSIVDSTAEIAQKNRRLIIMSIAAAAILVSLAFLIKYIIKKNRETKKALMTACIDSMTGAYNRNTYEEDIAELEKNIERCKKIYLTACDVNFLKYINDNYGHDSGDKAIIRCAFVLRRVVGKKGRVYRVGGDEFMCITDNDFTDAMTVEFAREALDYKGYPFSAAVGTAHYDPKIDLGGADIKALVARSDKAMYEHKVIIKKEVDFI
ncbi:MAG: carbohydrate binding domain-containing protein [Ruminococcus sp.]|nr:carbohydrate binding domain-containing protein [Ruminococcus sp.]